MAVVVVDLISGMSRVLEYSEQVMRYTVGRTSHQIITADRKAFD